MSGLQDAAASCKQVEPAIRSAIKTSVASSWHFISACGLKCGAGEGWRRSVGPIM